MELVLGRLPETILFLERTLPLRDKDSLEALETPRSRPSVLFLVAPFSDPAVWVELRRAPAT